VHHLLKVAPFAERGLRSLGCCLWRTAKDARRPAQVRDKVRHEGKENITNLALSVQQLHSLSALGVSDGVVFAFFVVTHVVERSR
jgi:hypothetical protein